MKATIAILSTILTVMLLAFVTYTLVGIMGPAGHVVSGIFAMAFLSFPLVHWLERMEKKV